MGRSAWLVDRSGSESEGKGSMRYLVQMQLVAPGRPTIAGDGTTFIRSYILPTLEICRKLEAEGRIVAGGPTSAAVGLVLLVEANSAEELDELVTSLPVWPRMETVVTPLTTFGARAAAVRSLLDQFEAGTRSAA